MIKPKRPGAPIDSERYQKWTDRFVGYRRNVTKKKLADWIEQFAEPDHDIAARILDSIEYINLEQLENGLAQVLSRLPGWHKTKKHRRGKWRFVAFSKSAAESGQAMIYSLRSAAKLGATTYDRLFIDKRDLLGEELGPEDSVVFVDDFTGTGNQACTGWPELMSELLPDEPKVYLMLVAACVDAKKRIQDETRMSVRNWRTLKSRENFFSSDCTYFSAQDKRKVLKYCRTADRKEPKGYGDCGLLLSFSHKTPNDSLPILHKDNTRWSGILPR